MLKLLLALIVIHATLSTGIPLPQPTSQPAATPIDLATKIASLPELKQIAESHMRSDPGFQAALKRIKSDEFQKKLLALHENAEWQKLKAYFHDAGFDLEPFINHALHCLNNTSNAIIPGAENVAPDLTSLFADMKNLTIPLLKAISPDMPMLENIVEKLLDPQFKVVFGAAFKTPEMGAVLGELKGIKGIPVDDALIFIKSFLGWDEKTAA